MEELRRLRGYYRGAVRHAVRHTSHVTRYTLHITLDNMRPGAVLALALLPLVAASPGLLSELRAASSASASCPLQLVCAALQTREPGLASLRAAPFMAGLLALAGDTAGNSSRAAADTADSAFLHQLRAAVNTGAVSCHPAPPHHHNPAQAALAGSVRPWPRTADWRTARCCRPRCSCCAAAACSCAPSPGRGAAWRACRPWSPSPGTTTTAAPARPSTASAWCSA